MRRTILALLLATLSMFTVLPTAQTASAQATEPAQRIRTVTYAGLGAETHLGHLGPISGTGPAFRQFVDRKLHRLWAENDFRPACKSSATIIVKTWRSDGYALLSEVGNFGRCPGGGWLQIAVRQDGTWRAPVALAAQEPYMCRTLAKFDVPPAVTPDNRCFNGDNRLVRYTRWLARH